MYCCVYIFLMFFFQAEDGIRDLVRSRGLGDVYKRQDNTFVFVISDHGEMLGERGSWFKFQPFEWSVRVPMIVAGPGLARGRTEGRGVSLMDLLPTFNDLVSDGDPVAPVDPLDGASLAAMLHGSDGTRGDDVMIEFLGEGVYAPACILRKDGFKYVHCRHDPPMLFDLRSDPDERVNLAGRPAHAALESALHGEVLRRWNYDTLEQQILASQQRRLFAQAALLQGRWSAWDYQPPEDAARPHVRPAPRRPSARDQQWSPPGARVAAGRRAPARVRRGVRGSVGWALLRADPDPGGPARGRLVATPGAGGVLVEPGVGGPGHGCPGRPAHGDGQWSSHSRGADRDGARGAADHRVGVHPLALIHGPVRGRRRSTPPGRRSVRAPRCPRRRARWPRYLPRAGSARRRCSTRPAQPGRRRRGRIGCLLYTSDAADERSSVDLGGRRLIQKKNKKKEQI